MYTVTELQVIDVISIERNHTKLQDWRCQVLHCKIRKKKFEYREMKQMQIK